VAAIKNEDRSCAKGKRGKHDERAKRRRNIVQIHPETRRLPNVKRRHENEYKRKYRGS
jgi:hypothetical protein